MSLGRRGGGEGKTPPDMDGGLFPSALALNRCNMAIREGGGGNYKAGRRFWVQIKEGENGALLYTHHRLTQKKNLTSRRFEKLKCLGFFLKRENANLDTKIWVRGRSEVVI